MATTRDLHLHEAILLLALHDEHGTTTLGSMHAYAMAGAIVAELLLRERVRMEDDGRRKRKVAVIDHTPVGELVLDAALVRIRKAKRRDTLERWITRLAGTRNLVHDVARSLCRRGILRADEDRVLLLFKRKVYPEVDPMPERELIERMRGAIFQDPAPGDGMPPTDPATAAIVALANGAGLLTNVFTKKELKGRKARLAELMAASAVGEATREAIEAVTAAIVAATVTATVVTS